MSRIPFSIFFLALFSIIYAGGAATAQEGGAYVVYVGGQAVAEESFAVEKLADGRTRSVSRIGTNSFTTVNKNKRPVEFSIESNGTLVLKTVFADGEARTVVTGQPEKTLRTAPAAVLENGVWSQYGDLLAQYDGAKGGAQYVTGFLPSQTLEMPLTLERTGTKDFKVGGLALSLTSYKLTYPRGGLSVEILAERTEAPLLIAIPSQMVKVVKKGYEGLLAATEKAAAAAGAGKEETAVHNGEFTGEEVSFPNGENTLAGTLTLPKNEKTKHPAVIIITGSGGQDRDGSGHLFNLYKQIAESLSKAGLAVLRVDDRGVGKSTLNPVKAAETSYRDLISDSRAALDYLAARKEIDNTKIALLGHSEGAETALTIAAEEPARVAALILLAGSSRPVDRVVAEQELYQRAWTETADAADRSKVMPVAQNLMSTFEKARAPQNAADPRLAWFREHLASDPSALARQVKSPVLIVQGERDVLVLAYHAVALADAFVGGGNKKVSLRILPNLTHIFTPITEIKEEAAKTSPTLFPVLQNWARANLLQ